MNPNQIINQPMELNCLQINLRHSKLAAADILISLPLSILHQLARNLNFVPGGISMIDVTLGGDKTNVIDWQFLDFDSLSDHPFVMVYSGRLPFVSEIQTKVTKNDNEGQGEPGPAGLKPMYSARAARQW